MTGNTFILHLGMPRSGTIAIHHFLDLNVKRIEQLGIEYLPCDLRLYRGWPLHRTRNDDPISLEDLFSPVHKALKNSDALYSNEAFGNVVEEQPHFVKDLVQLFPDNPIKIVVYLRRQDTHYESVCVNNIKEEGDSRKFNPVPSPDYMFSTYGQTTKVYDYDRWLAAIQQELREEDSLVVRRTEKRSFYGDSIYSDFIFALGLKWDPNFETPRHRVNPSLDGRYTELCRKLAAYYKANNPQHHSSLETAIFYTCLLHINALTGRNGKKDLFSHEERLAFLEQYEESNKKVADLYFPGEETLFDMSDLDSSEQNGQDSFTQEELEEVVMVMYRIWFDIACKGRFRVLNYLRMNYYRKKRKTDRSKKVKFWLFVHKTIQSIGKRLCKGWGETGPMEGELRALPSDVVSLEDLIKEYANFKEVDSN